MPGPARIWLFPLCLVALLGACSVAVDDPDDPQPPVADVPPEDLVPTDGIKGDGAGFDPSHVMDDTAFADPYLMTEAELQAFFEHTPYGSRSFFADHRFGGRLAADIVAATAAQYRISPMVLLVKLQVEMGLVSKTAPPSQYKLDRAMGCGCFSGNDCDSFLGFAAQVDCAAKVFRSYLDDLEAGGSTVAGWRVGQAKKSLDGVWVTPRSRATAALYTYTPWVLRGEGGNWLFWNIYRKYARVFRDGRPNYHWVGGTCGGSVGCPVAGGSCELSVQGGLCMSGCEQLCPDSLAPFTSGTFCADVGTARGGAAAGACLAHCDEDLHPDNEGCRSGFACRLSGRFNEPGKLKRVCWPAGW